MDNPELEKLIKEIWGTIVTGWISYGLAFMFIFFAFRFPGYWWAFLPGAVIMGIIGHLCFHRAGDLK